MKISRPTKQDWAMSLAEVTAQRGTCLRRRVGCVLLNERGHVIGTGYNGRPAGQKHCNHQEDKGIFDTPDGNPLGFGVEIPIRMEPWHPFACAGATAKSGTQLDGCEAVHAEQNALMQCGDVYAIHTCFVTASPCMTCVKMLLNTSCKFIFYREEYPHTEALVLWTKSDRQAYHWTHEPSTRRLFEV